MTDETAGRESLFPARLRVFEVDFNDPRDELLAGIRWWSHAPVPGEEVLLVDSDWDVTKGRVVRVHTAPDNENRKDGLVICESDYSAWMDGEQVLTLARNFLEQTTRGHLVLGADLG